MTTTITNSEVINLVRSSFDEDGYPIKKGKTIRQKKAKEILESGANYYGETVDGFDVHNCLLIIAYPNKNI